MILRVILEGMIAANHILAAITALNTVFRNKAFSQKSKMPSDYYFAIALVLTGPVANPSALAFPAKLT